MRAPQGHAQQVDDIEMSLLLEGAYLRYGYDFRGYARPSLRRRLNGFMLGEGLETLSAVQERLLRDPACLKRLVLALSVNVTALFRDPGFFLAFRRDAVPLLRTYPLVRIWHAGCATGEEVYSMAILLHEEGLYPRCRLYATDMDAAALKRARDGIFDLDASDQYASNYAAAGGTKALTEYYTAAYGHGIFRGFLKQNMVFSQHNLATDGSFNEFQAILCRNVMIYFGGPLQSRVHELLYESLVPFGLLALGSKETLQFTSRETCYEPVAPDVRLYRKAQ